MAGNISSDVDAPADALAVFDVTSPADEQFQAAIVGDADGYFVVSDRSGEWDEDASFDPADLLHPEHNLTEWDIAPAGDIKTDWRPTEREKKIGDFDPNQMRVGKGMKQGGQFSKSGAGEMSGEAHEGLAGKRAGGIKAARATHIAQVPAPSRWQKIAAAEAESFVSPNVGNLSFEQAVEGIDSPRQKALAKANKDIDKLLDIQSDERNVIGAWSDGAENSMMMVMHGATPEKARAAAAMKGYIADQKQVLLFTPTAETGKGQHGLVSFSLNKDIGATHKQLSDAGIVYHTLDPKSEQLTRVHVLVQDDDTLDAVNKVALTNGSDLKFIEGTGEFIGDTGKQEGKGSGRQQRDRARVSYEAEIRSALEAGDAEAWGELRDHWLSEFADLPLQGVAATSHPAKISPSLTSTNKAGLDSNEVYVATGVATMAADQAAFKHNIHLHANAKMYNGMRREETKGDAKTVAMNVINRISDNLRFLLSKATAAELTSKDWYRTANKIIQEKASKLGYEVAAVAGAFAALSPQKDWDQNVYFAGQLIDIYSTKQEQAWTPEMAATATQLFTIVPANIKDPKKLEKAKLKAKQNRELIDQVISRGTLGSLHDADHVAMWIRTYEETYGDPEQPPSASPKVKGSTVQHERGYRQFGSQGLGEYRRNKLQKGETVGKKATAGWGTIEQIANAVTALRSNGDRNIISDAMGNVHKVRNFYNNLLDPESVDGDVTIDSHAIDASWLRPLAEAAKHHGLAMSPGAEGGGGKRPDGWVSHKNSKGYGAMGTYGLYADAYRKVAAENDMLPAELQAVIWVVKRDAFLDMTNANVAAIKDHWDAFHDGKQDLKSTQDAVWSIVEQDRAAKRK